MYQHFTQHFQLQIWLKKVTKSTFQLQICLQNQSHKHPFKNNDNVLSIKLGLENTSSA
jgi:hypothetical protein